MNQFAVPAAILAAGAAASVARKGSKMATSEENRFNDRVLQSAVDTAKDTGLATQLNRETPSLVVADLQTRHAKWLAAQKAAELASPQLQSSAEQSTHQASHPY